MLDVRPLGDDDGASGWLVTHRRSGAWLRQDRRTTRAHGVIVAAGALGTNELLRRCRDAGSLPDLSPRLGRTVRTNSETITAATALTAGVDLRSDVAITTSIWPDAQTHVTNNTYGAGGDALALNFGPLTGGRGRLRQLAGAWARHPVRQARAAQPRGWSQRTIIFTVMQSADNALRLVAGPRGRLRTEGDAQELPASFLPVANRVAAIAARRLGGVARSSLAETARNAPTTAHILGGAAIGATAQTGVVDRHRRVFGYRNLLVCDGSTIPANPGVNPSLTITAMAEEAMSHVPPRVAASAPPMGVADAG